MTLEAGLRLQAMGPSQKYSFRCIKCGREDPGWVGQLDQFICKTDGCPGWGWGHERYPTVNVRSDGIQASATIKGETLPAEFEKALLAFISQRMKKTLQESPELVQGHPHSMGYAEMKFSDKDGGEYTVGTKDLSLIKIVAQVEVVHAGPVFLKASFKPLYAPHDPSIVVINLD